MFPKLSVPSQIRRSVAAIGLGMAATLTPLQQIHPDNASDERIAASITEPRESVREELARLHRVTGLSLVVLQENTIYSIDFLDRKMIAARKLPIRGTAASGSISPDGTSVAFSLCPEPGFTHPTPYRTDCPGGPEHLGLIRTDGTGFREYPYLVYPFPICWSPDGASLAMQVEDRKQNPYATGALQVLDLRSGTIRVIVDDFEAFVSAQCWSPDDREIAYWLNRPGSTSIRVYDFLQHSSKDLSKGEGENGAGWSPDGQWIAYLVFAGTSDPLSSAEYSTYYIIRPSAEGRKVLLRTFAEGWSLTWSPDARYVAYVGSSSWSNERRLWVRRLEDGSEDWVATLAETDSPWYQWILNPRLQK